MVHTPTLFCRIIRLATNTAFRRREQQKALSDSLAFENASIEWLKSYLAKVQIPIVRVCIV